MARPRSWLDRDERVTEIARMLGGDPESDVSLAHARELLSAAAHDAPETSGRGTRKLAKNR